MDTNTKLTREQIILISLLGTIGNIVYIHTFIDDSTNGTAWIASFIGICLIIPFAIWIFFLGKSCPSGTLFDILKAGIGKVSTIFILSIYIIINIATAVTHLNLFASMIETVFLLNTPAWIIMTFLLCTATLVISGRVRTFARLVELLSILGILNYFITFIFAFPKNVDFKYITPIFDTSVLGFIKGVLFIASSASECLLIFMIFVRFVPDPSKHYLWIVKGIASSAVIFSFAVLIIILMMSSELAKRIAFGGVNAARLIRVGEFIQGLEILVFITYQYIAIGKISICLFCASSASKIIFGNKKPLLHLIIMSVSALALSIWMTSYVKAYFTAVFLANYVNLPFSIVVLLLASLSVKIKNKRTGRVQK